MASLALSRCWSATQRRKRNSRGGPPPSRVCSICSSVTLSQAARRARPRGALRTLKQDEPPTYLLIQVKAAASVS